VRGVLVLVRGELVLVRGLRGYGVWFVCAPDWLVHVFYCVWDLVRVVWDLVRGVLVLLRGAWDLVRSVWDLVRGVCGFRCAVYSVGISCGVCWF
jgi:hypothetical protein